MKKVEVIWRDIMASQGWHSVNQLDNFCTEDDNIVCQIGYLYEKDEHQVVLVNAYFTNKSQFGSVEKIPTGCIISIKEI